MPKTPRKKQPKSAEIIGKPIVTGPIPTPPLIVFDDLESFNVAKLPAGGSTLAIRIDDGRDWRSVEVFDGGTGEKIGELVGGRVTMLDGTERTIMANTDGRWSSDGITLIESSIPIGYAALLSSLREEFPSQILPEPPITDAEWFAMIEAIRASEEDVIALPVPASCADDAALRACAEALRVTACALGIGLVFYPRFEGVHRDRSGKEPRNERVPAALMVRRVR